MEYRRLIASVVTEQDVADINTLLPQLTPAAKPIAVQEISMVAADSIVLVARNEEKRIVGMGTLHICHKLTGTTGIIEDVVVDRSSCGHGIGAALMMNLITAARGCGLKNLTLTSKPERVAANRLYQKLGFEIRETNHYRMIL